MKRVITREDVACLVRSALPELASDLPEDVLAALQDAKRRERGERAREALALLIDNAHIARSERVALCQDTGSVWLCLEFGPDVVVSGDVFADVNAAVADVYLAHRLRTSLVHDALCDRSNTGNNTPAFCELSPTERPGARVHLMCKGGGSDNASRVVMLPPSAGRAGLKDELLACVREKGANACPPLVIGVGVGATFDTVALLAKHALMRPLGSAARSSELADFERELLDAVNATGMGAAALGGDTTALAVHVETAPCHIAAFPVAINMGCSALRRGSYEL